MSHKIEQAISRIQELQFSFSANLNTHIKELYEISAHVDVQQPPMSKHNASSIKETYHLAHKLAGSAGTFQFTEVYEAAKVLEKYCFTLVNSQSNVVNKTWYAEVERLLLSLKEASLNTSDSLVKNKVLTPLLPVPEPQLDETQQYNIVLVDDDTLLTALIQEQAKHFGYTIHAINNPEQLSCFLEQQSPDIILMDIVFPQYDFTGIDLVKRLKAEGKIQCPVIFLSNRDDFDARLEAVQAGGDGYIVKPINIVELVETIEQKVSGCSVEPYKVLFISSDTEISLYYQNLLSSANFVFQSFEQPDDVINGVSDFLPDVIVLEMTLVCGNSFEIANVFLQDNRFTHIPIVFLLENTASQQQYQEKGLQLGCDNFLTEDMSDTSFIANINSYCKQSRALYAVINRLKQDELRFQSVSYSSSDAIISLNKEGTIILWNEGAENIFGYRSLEVIGQSIELIIPPKYRSEHHGGLYNFINDKQSSTKRTIESHAMTKGKALISIELTYTEWQSGNEYFYTSIIRDVSQRKTIENELKHQKENLNAIIINSAEGIITIDEHGIVEIANPKALEMFGYEEGELVGENISILMAEELRHQHGRYVQESKINSVTEIFNKAREIEGLHKDGSFFPLELNVSPMMINGARKYVGILHDVTEWRKALAVVTEAKLDAENANKAKSQFLSSMSHELRTPLNAILGFTQLLQEESSLCRDAEASESLEYIFDAGKHLLQLIDEVLDLSKIEAGKLSIQLESINLIMAIKKSINFVSQQASDAQIAINFSESEQKPLLIAVDNLRLNQILNNLLTNAIKYNKPQGKIDIWISDFKHKVRIHIKDTGGGIPENRLKEIFQPFHRLGAENSTIKGTGIGLTITKVLVEMMQGSIGVDNVEGEGCTFWVDFKKEKGGNPATDRELLSEMKQDKVCEMPSTLEILYIEDNAANRLLMKKMINRNTGFKYTEAFNGEEGIEAVSNSQPQILLLDINLPDMDGFEVFNRLQEQNLLAGTKVIIVSANAMLSDINKAKALGVFDYITKPIDQKKLFKVLDLVLSE